jgi:hypothetical protein
VQRINRRARLALAHGNRGRKPVQAGSRGVQRQVIQRASTSYAVCNYQDVRDLLAERDGIELSRTSVRRIRLSAGIGSPKKQRREDAAGSFLLVQQMLELHGRPLAFCHDRHGIFAQTSKATEADTLEEQLVGKQDPPNSGAL